MCNNDIKRIDVSLRAEISDELRSVVDTVVRNLEAIQVLFKENKELLSNVIKPGVKLTTKVTDSSSTDDERETASGTHTSQAMSCVGNEPPKRIRKV